jgi:hypothetical protein
MGAENQEVQIINGQCYSLPCCPLCGGLTNLEEITIRRVGGGGWSAFVLRCARTVDPYERPASTGWGCPYAIPLEPFPKNLGGRSGGKLGGTVE